MVAMEMQQFICACACVCFVELHVTVSKTNIMGVVQEYSRQIYVANNNKMYLVFIWGPWYNFSNLNRIWTSWQTFIKVPSIKFHKNLSSWSHADTCGHDRGNRSLYYVNKIKTCKFQWL
jgi:hypothetical protein